MSSAVDTKQASKPPREKSKKRKSTTANDVPADLPVFKPSEGPVSVTTSSEPKKKKRKQKTSDVLDAVEKASSALAESTSGASVADGKGKRKKDGKDKEDKETKRARKAVEKEGKSKKADSAASTSTSSSASSRQSSSSFARLTPSKLLPVSASAPPPSAPSRRMFIPPPALPSTLSKPKPKPAAAPKPKATSKSKVLPVLQPSTSSTSKITALSSSSSTAAASLSLPSLPTTTKATEFTVIPTSSPSSSKTRTHTKKKSPATTKPTKAIAPPSSHGDSSEVDPASDSDSHLASVPPTISTASIGYPPHIAALICEKFYTSADLVELEKKHGFQAKRGKWSKVEEEAAEAALKEYGRVRSLTSSQTRNLIFDKDKKGDHKKFWHEIGAKIPGRPLRLIVQFLRRKYNALAHQGPWTAEEDAKLKAAYISHGPEWKKIEPLVLRPAADCKDRWTKQLDPKLAGVDKGTWTKEATASLESIVRAMLAKENLIDWETVSSKLGSKRSPHQCMAKWNSLPAPTTTDTRVRKTWSFEENIKLLKSMSAYKDASEVPWNSLAEGFGRNGIDVKKHWQTIEARAGKKIKQMKLKDAISYILANADDLLRMKKEPRPKLEKGKEGKTFKSKETIDTDDEGDSD